MKNLNKVELIGTVTADPTIRETGNGYKFATFTVATNRYWKSNDGEPKHEATFHKVIVWQKLAEVVETILQKGSKVYIEGRLRNRTWDDAEGQKHEVTEIEAKDIINLSYKPKTDAEVTPEIAEDDGGFMIAEDDGGFMKDLES